MTRTNGWWTPGVLPWLLVAAWFVVPPVNAQACHDPSVVNDLCKPYVNYSVWEEAEGQLVQQNEQLQIAFQFASSARPPCQAVVARSLCSRYYQCNETQTGPLKICAYVCDDITSTCTSDFDDEEFECPPEWLTMDQRCTAALPYTGSFPLVACPEGLVTFEGYCDLPCLDVSYTDKEWDAFIGTASVFCWFSLASTVFLLLTQFLNPARRDFRNNLTPWLGICFTLTAFTLCWGTLYGWEDFYCVTDGAGFDFGAPACEAFAVFFVWSTWATAVWWLNICINMLIIVTTQELVIPWWRLAFHHGFGWGLPTLIVIIGLSVDKLGGNYGELFCTWKADINVESDSWWEVGLYTIPLSIIFMVGTFILIVVLFKVFKTNGKTAFRAQWRLVAVTLAVLTFYLFPIMVSFYNHSQFDDVKDTVIEWINCSLTAADGVGCHYETTTNFPLTYLALFFDVSGGFWVSLIFTLSHDNLKFWKRFWIDLFVNHKLSVRKSDSLPTNINNTGTKKIEGKHVTPLSSQPAGSISSSSEEETL
ncbi:Wnt-activated receptor [Balamuthia mandrillaris]